MGQKSEGRGAARMSSLVLTRRAWRREATTNQLTSEALHATVGR